MENININLFEILTCLSGAVDLARPELSNHHHQVAYLACRLAEKLNLPVDQQRDILMAGLVHDIGAFTVDERLSLIEDESVTMLSHAFRGAKLLKECPPFAKVADAVCYHHLPWDDGAGTEFLGTPVPQASHILHLADRTDSLINRGKTVLSQIPDIMKRIKQQSGHTFCPPVVDALISLSDKESIWLELTDKAPLDCIPDISYWGMVRLSLNDIVSVAELFSQVIDFRSRFTATHSVGVANTAQKLAELIGFSQNECLMMLTAGYLHDLGKLAIDNAVLEKPSALNTREYDIMRSHTYYTYRLLEQIKGFETINQWASFHHEKLDGTGYPFNLSSESLPLGSRIMAVADIFTAVTEHRPYRAAMSMAQVAHVLQRMADERAICPKVTKVALDNLALLTDTCQNAEKAALERYQRFLNENSDSCSTND